MKILLALSIISIIFVVTPTFGEECVSSEKKNLIIGDIICSHGKTRLSSLDSVEVFFDVCISEKPEFSKAKFEISTSLESVNKTYSWTPLSGWDEWCITSDDVKLKIPPYTETARVDEDLTVVYIGPDGENLREIDEKKKQKAEELMKQKLTEERRVSIVDVYQHFQLEDRYYVILEICASGSEQLRDPIIIVRSDSDEIQSNIHAIMAPQTCSVYETKAIVAKDPNSFVADFAENLSHMKTSTDLEKRIFELEKEITDLKGQIEKKDAVLMEQLKVISNLAAMIQKTI